MFNDIMCAFFDALCIPFASLHPWWGISGLSLLTGIVMLLVFRLTSDQEAIRRVKNRIKAHILEIRLYGDDLSLMLDAQKSILRQTLAYMRYSAPSMIFLIVPVVLIMIQLSLWYDRHPVRPGESVIITAAFADGAPLHEQIALRAPEGLVVETPPVRIPEKNEVLWRIKGVHNGAYDLALESNSGVVTKQVVVSESRARLSVRRVASSFWQCLLYPGERSITPETQVAYIEVAYRPIVYRLLGWNLHWLVIFFILSIAAGFLFKGLFRVEV